MDDNYTRLAWLLLLQQCNERDWYYLKRNLYKMNKFAAMDLLLWPAAPLTGPGIIFRATKQRRALVSISRGTETTKVQVFSFGE